MRSLKYVFVVFLALFIAGLFFFANFQNSSAPYSAKVLETGKVESIEHYQGKVVMLNRWATWCEPCREEIPALVKLHEEFSPLGFTVIGVSIDPPNSEKQIRFFTKNMEVNYPIWLDPDDRFARILRSIGVPHTVLFDAEGKVVYEWKGQFDPLSEDTKIRVQQALGLVEVELKTGTHIGTVGILAAIVAGLLSFLSPCFLPLIPAYISFITGLSNKDLTKKRSVRTKAFSRGLFFVLGFSAIFILLGSTVAFVGSLFLNVSAWIERVGGVILLILGLHLIGVLQINRLAMQANLFKTPKRSTGNATSFIVGAAFGAGWTPCIGPVLAAILTLAATSSSAGTGAVLLAAYSVGLAVPFLLSALAVDKFLIFFDKIKGGLVWVERISGVLLIIIGLVLLLGWSDLLFGVLGNFLWQDVAVSLFS